MSEKRPQGAGTVYELPSGRWIARLPLPNGRRRNLGTHDTEDEAQGVLDAALELAATQAPTGGVTMLGWFPRWLDELELSRSYVAMPTARSVWRNWVSKAPFAALPLRAITANAVERWIGDLAKRPIDELSDGWLDQILRLTRKGLDAARREHFLDENPAAGVKVPRRPAPTEETWTYLHPPEQRAIATCEHIEEWWRLVIEFATVTGLRAGEQFCQRVTDVHVGHDPHVFVRYGSPKRAPKGRRMRRVPLLPRALACVKRILELLPTWCPPKLNTRGLLFPGSRGGLLHSDRFAAQEAGEDGPFTEWLGAAGIHRHVRWHDLRHTCAASLISGWWGRPWRLEEIRDFLGHKSIDETQRYAHLAPDALSRAARETPGQPTPSQRLIMLPGESARFVSLGVDDGGGSEHEAAREDSTASWPAVGLARRLVETVAAGRAPGSLPDELAEAVIGGVELRLARAVLAGGDHALDRALELAELLLGRREPDSHVEALAE